MRFVMLLMIAGGTMWAMSIVAARFRAFRAARTAGVALVIVLAGLMPVPSHAQQAQKPTVTTHTTMSGVFTAKQAEQGRAVFNANCLGCHTAASHTGPMFTGRWIGQPLSELFTYIASYMPKSEPGVLSEDEYVWVTAYMLRLNGMPAGTTPLTAEQKLLDAIRIDSVPIAKKSAGLSHLRPSLQHLPR